MVPGLGTRRLAQEGRGNQNLKTSYKVCPLYHCASQATLTWTRGHAGDPGNELADQWANKAREQNIASIKSLKTFIYTMGSMQILFDESDKKIILPAV